MADEFSERDDAIGYQFRVLYEVGGVADTRNQDLPGAEFHVAPDFVFMFVTDLARSSAELKPKTRHREVIDGTYPLRESGEDYKAQFDLQNGSLSLKNTLPRKSIGEVPQT